MTNSHVSFRPQAYCSECGRELARLSNRWDVFEECREHRISAMTNQPRREDERMEPSKEAVEAFHKVLLRDFDTCLLDRIAEGLRAANAIDCDAHQQDMQGLQAENERLKKSYHVEVCQKLDEDNIRLQARVEELESDVNHNAGRVVQEAQRADRLQSEAAAIKEMYRQQCVSTTDCGAKLDKANQQLAIQRALADRLKLESEIQAQEARTQRATVHEIYQLITGATGEPGDWNGAEPADDDAEDFQDHSHS